MRQLKRYEEFEDDAGRLVRYRRTESGALVAEDAEVAGDATLGAETWVDPGARVLAGARIGAHGWVERDALIGPHATVGGHVHVGRGAVVGRGATVGDRATLGAGARVEPGRALGPDVRLPDVTLRPAGRTPSGHRAA